VSDTYSRAWALSWFAAGGVSLGLGRLALRQWVQGMSVAGRFANRTVIVGAGEQGRRLAGYLRRHGDANTRLIGFADDRGGRVPRESEGLRLLGSVDQLIEMIRRDQVDQVIVALPWTADRRLREEMASQGVKRPPKGQYGVGMVFLPRDPASRRATSEILTLLAGRNLYFVDSRTSADTLGYTLARSLGVPAAERQIFLDAEADQASIRGQWLQLLESARRRGAALAIAHPHDDTLEVLA